MSEATRKLANVLQIDDAQVRGHPSDFLHGPGEETLNGLLDAVDEPLGGPKR